MFDIKAWCDNVHRHGYYSIITDKHGYIHIENDAADFESEKEFNECMAAEVAFDDNHTRM